MKEVPLEREAPRVPLRTCVGCRNRRPQNELIRLVRTLRGIRHDPRRRLPGRGAYLCPDPECVRAAAGRDAGALRRALRGGTAEQAQHVLAAVRATAEHHEVPHGTVRSENA